MSCALTSSEPINTENVQYWRISLPADVVEPFVVYVNGVPQKPEIDFVLRGRVLEFPRPLLKEGKLGFWRWFWGAWGVGTYRKNDQVDVAWEVDGKPRLVHAIDIQPPVES